MAKNTRQDWSEDMFSDFDNDSRTGGSYDPKYAEEWDPFSADTDEDRPARKSSKKNKVIFPAAVALVAIVLLAFLLLRRGPQHVHSWRAATCTSPKTCEKCGVAEGGALGHAWRATDCTSPRVCERCDERDHSTGGHSWQAATYRDPQRCRNCGVTQGESLSAFWARKPISTPTGIVGVSAGGWSTYALTDWGKVYAIGRDQDGQNRVSHWSDVVDISGGDRHVAILRADGTVDAIGQWEHGQCDVHSWRDIIAISSGVYCTVGIRSDGTVMLAGNPPAEKGVVFDVSGWRDIVQINAGEKHIAAVRCDGTVVATGMNNYGQCDVSHWRDIIAVATGTGYTLGLRSDGTVVAVGDNSKGGCNVSDWTDIVAIDAGAAVSVGLRKDGTVVVAGMFTDKDIVTRWKENEYAPRSWRNVIQISVRYNQIFALTKDGEILSCGFNTYKQCNVEDLYDKVFNSPR